MKGERSALAEYLRARRGCVQPEDVGLPRQVGRRVAGLRREEVADLAGISPEYYLRLEQGRDHQPSEQVLTALARALQLDDDGRSYLLRLARPTPSVRRQQTRPDAVDEGMLRLLDQWSHTPAYLCDRNQDVLAANDLARAFAPGFLEPGTNLVVSTFEGYAQALAEAGADTDGEPVTELSAWDPTFRALVAALRFHSDPDDPRLQEIVGTLSLRFRRFRQIWALHEARPHNAGARRALVEPLGWVEFRWQTLEVPGTDGQLLTTFFGDPGSPAVAAIAYLAASTARATPAGAARQPV